MWNIVAAVACDPALGYEELRLKAHRDSIVTQVIIRKPGLHEAERLTEIAHAANRHWGYPETLMRLWVNDLTISNAAIESGFTFCAVLESDIIGFYVLSHEGPEFELDHLWIDTAHMKRGYGAQLFAHALDTIRSHGGTSLRIASDPNAEPFYRRMGARLIGQETSIPAGRTIPVLIIATDGR